MTKRASRDGDRWARGPVPDTPGFRRRHRVLAWLLALHLPALAGLAFLAERPSHEILVGAAVVVLALVVGAFLDISPRLRALALTLGLLWCSVVVGMATETLVWGLLHGGIVGLLVSAHMGSAWNYPRFAPGGDAEETATGSLGAAKAHAADGPVANDGDHVGHGDVPVDRADDRQVATDARDGQSEEDDGLVEVQELYTGVWSSRRLVRPRTHRVRLSNAEAVGGSGVNGTPPTAGTSGAAGPGAGEPVSPGAAEWTSAVPGQTPSGHPAPPPPPPASGATEARDPNLTREVLEALHLGATDDDSVAHQWASSGQGR